MEEKRCTRCKEMKKLGEFYADKRRSDGHRSACKVCMQADSQAYTATHKEERHTYRETHRKKTQAYNKQYYIENTDTIKTQTKRYYAEHRETGRATRKQYYETHKKEVQAALALRVERNKKWYARYCKAHPCKACGKSPPGRCHHHPGKKNYNVSALIQNGAPISKIEAEIVLCVFLCRSCHGKLHAELRKHKSTEHFWQKAA